MPTRYDKQIALQVSPEQVWTLLADVRATLACWPGSQIAAPSSSRHYPFTMRTRVAAANVFVTGEFEVLGLDAARRELRARGIAASKAAGATANDAALTLALTVRADAGTLPGDTALVLQVTLDADGRLAEPGSALVAPAVDACLAEFVENLRVAVLQRPAPMPARTGATAAPARHGSRASSGTDSTLTLMVQAGQEPGAAFAGKDAKAAAPLPPDSAWASLRKGMARWFGGSR